MVEYLKGRAADGHFQEGKFYTDSVHLITDGRQWELHDFAERIGLRRIWYQEMPAHAIPHYDILSPRILARALVLGAVEVTPKQLVRIWLEKNESPGSAQAL
jgi:hypothetical protein